MSKVEITGNKAVIRLSEVQAELKTRLSPEDVSMSASIMNRAREKRDFLRKMFSGKLCPEECGYKDTTRSIPFGDFESEIMFVRKAPTRMEHVSMFSHSDTEGYMLMLILSKLGVNPEDFYFTDFMKCYPGEKIHAPSCVLCMKSYFLKELDIVKPKLIIAEGSQVLNALNSRVFESSVPCVPGMVSVTTIRGGMLVQASCIYDTSLMFDDIPESSVIEKKGSLWKQVNQIFHSYYQGGTNGKEN